MFEIFNKKAEGDEIDFESMYVVVDSLEIRGYQMQHYDVCKRLWNEHIPEHGQADTLQAELLRQLECLRCEACDNGNRNWDDNFEWFCGFISESLRKSNLFDNAKIDKLINAIEYIKECGEYAYKYHNGEISDEDANPMLFAYTDDDLYDYIEDAIAEFSIANPQPIPYEVKDFIYR